MSALDASEAKAQNQRTLNSLLLNSIGTELSAVIIVVKCIDGTVVAADTQVIKSLDGSKRIEQIVHPLHEEVGVVWYAHAGTKTAKVVLQHTFGLDKPLLQHISSPLVAATAFLTTCTDYAHEALTSPNVKTQVIIIGANRAFQFTSLDGVFQGDYSAACRLEVAKFDEPDHGFYVGGCGEEEGTKLLLDILRQRGLLTKDLRSMEVVEDIVLTVIRDMTVAEPDTYNSPVDVVKISAGATHQRFIVAKDQDPQGG